MRNGFVNYHGEASKWNQIIARHIHWVPAEGEKQKEGKDGPLVWMNHNGEYVSIFFHRDFDLLWSAFEIMFRGKDWINSMLHLRSARLRVEIKDRIDFYNAIVQRIIILEGYAS